MINPNDLVHVYKQVENGKLRLGIHFQDSANLQDLLEAWQPLCDDRSIYKAYASDNHDQCRGCQTNCCNTAYVIPDLIAFKRMAELTHLAYADFVDRYFAQDKLEIGLLRMKPNPCIFLQNNVCTVYPARSLICRFYLCTSLLADTEELIYRISWVGAAATQVFAEANGLLPPRKSGLSSFDNLFLNLIDEYRGQDMVKRFLDARTYADIPLSIFNHGQ